MPLYEYKCLECERTTEKIESVKGPHVKKCPHCGGKVEALISRSAIQFKGAGWYVTDYAGKKAAGAAGAGEKPGGDTKASDTKSGDTISGDTTASKESKEKASKHCNASNAASNASKETAKETSTKEKKSEKQN